MNINILIVKKQKAVVRYWTEVFEKVGYVTYSYPVEDSDWQPFIQYHKPDILLIEAAFAGNNGFEMARLARQIHPALRCIVCVPALTSYYTKAIQSDISGYLPDDIDDTTEMLSCLEQVWQGYRYIHPQFVKALGLPTQQQATLLSTLSARKKQILRLVAKGYTARQIAQELAIAEATVRYHKEQTAELFGLPGVYQLKVFVGSILHWLE